MSKKYFERVHEHTPTRFWINNVTRDQARLAIENGAVGCTQNPSYTWKMIANESEKGYVSEKLTAILKQESHNDQALIALQRELIGDVAKIFYPLYETSGGKDGFVSIQGDPFREDVESILSFARYNRKAGENIMVKIPVTECGLKAIEQLIKENVPINATECMSVQQVIDVCELYEKTVKNMANPAPLYFSVITGIYDEYIKNQVKAENIDISSDIIWYAGLAIAKKVYEIMKERKYQAQYISGGARGLHHFTEMIGADCAVTINWNGAADQLLELNQPVVSRFFNPVPAAVIDELTKKLEDFKRGYFINGIKPEEYEEYGPVVLFRSQFETAWKNALAYIEDFRNNM